MARSSALKSISGFFRTSSSRSGEGKISDPGKPPQIGKEKILIFPEGALPVFGNQALEGPEVLYLVLRQPGENLPC